MEKTEFLLREWVTAYHDRNAGKDSRQAFVVFVQLMNQHGILKTDDLITRFFRMATQMCVDLCYRYAHTFHIKSHKLIADEK